MHTPLHTSNAHPHKRARQQPLPFGHIPRLPCLRSSLPLARLHRPTQPSSIINGGKRGGGTHLLPLPAHPTAPWRNQRGPTAQQMPRSAISQRTHVNTAVQQKIQMRGKAHAALMSGGRALRDVMSGHPCSHALDPRTYCSVWRPGWQRAPGLARCGSGPAAAGAPATANAPTDDGTWGCVFARGCGMRRAVV